MKTEANYVKPTPENPVQYYWVSADTLALACISRSFLRTAGNPKGLVILHPVRPKVKDKDGKPYKYLRIKLEVVRTKREAAALDRHWKGAAARGWRKFQAAMKKGGKKP